MVMNRKVTGTAASLPVGLAVGAVVSSAVTAAGSALAAKLVLGGSIPEGAIGYCAMVILLLASALGAWTAAGRIRHRRLYVCMLSGAVYYGCLLMLTALFFGGQYQGMGVTALVVLAGCVTAALLEKKGKGKPSGAGKRSKHR